jgi:3-hydroxyisobutyrate dehydrogenase/2-hydroxy-3-oxopropionate reductase
MATIGFIGLGNMGFPMSRNLLRGGHRVIGYDIAPSARERFVNAGGEVRDSVADVAREAELLCTSLPGPAEVEQVYLGSGGIAEHGHEGQVAIELSTIGPTLGRKVAAALAERGIGFVGAPVSGGVEGAEVATLTIMAGGKAADFERAKPLFDLLGKNIFHVDEDPGSGYIVKLINNFFIGFYTEAVAEAMTLADLVGFDKAKLFPILNVSYGRSGIYQRNYELFIAKERYDPGFALGLLLKDLTLAKAMADEHQARLPIFERLLEVYHQAAEASFAPKDMAAQYLFIKGLQASSTN